MTDVSNRAIVTLYQAEEEIYTRASTTLTVLPSTQPWHRGIANLFKQVPDQKHSAAYFRPCSRCMEYLELGILLVP